MNERGVMLATDPICPISVVLCPECRAGFEDVGRIYDARTVLIGGVGVCDFCDARWYDLPRDAMVRATLSPS